MQKPLVLFFYGTLKRGHYNHTRFNSEGIGRFMQEATVRGFSMIQPNGLPYPMAVHDTSGNIQGELYEVDVLDALAIHRMEVGAGYVLTPVITDDGIRTSMYVAERSPDGHSKFSYFGLPEIQL